MSSLPCHLRAIRSRTQQTQPTTRSSYTYKVNDTDMHTCSLLLLSAGSGGRNTLSLYSGYAPVVGPHNPGFFNHFGATVPAGSSSHTHSLLTQGNLANNNNNGNHTSTSISESQSAATKCVTVGGKRRHNSASDGHLSASSSKGLEARAVTSSMLLQGNDAHLASLVQGQSQGGQIPSSSQAHGSSSLYTGLDGKIGVDKVEHTDNRNGQSGHSLPREKDREVVGKSPQRVSHQRNGPISGGGGGIEAADKPDKEPEQFHTKRARTASTSRESLESHSGRDK